MRNLMAMALCLFALPAVAGEKPATSLWGAWKVTIKADRTYAGVMMVDRAGRATWDATWDADYRRANNFTFIGTGSAKSFGYVRDLGNEVIDIVLTDRDVVEHTHCALQSRDLLVCRNGATIITRVGPGPESLMPPSR